MIGKLIKRRMDELKIMLLITVGIFLLSTILLAVIMNNSQDEETTFAIGSMMIVISMTFFFTLMGIVGYPVEFNLAIGMGMTRKQFVPAYMITSLCMVFIESAISYLAFFIEKWEIQTFYAQYPYEKGIERILFSPYMILFVFAIVIVQIFLSTMSMRYGKKVFWGLWFVIMLCSVLPGRVEKAVNKGDGSFLDKIGNQVMKLIQSTSSTVVVLIAVVLLIVMLIGTYFFSRKQAYHLF